MQFGQPWGSVNNYMGSESDLPELDLSKPLSTSEKRLLTARLRKKKAAAVAKFTPGKPEQAGVIEHVIDEIKITAGIEITQGETLHLIGGGKHNFGNS